MTQQRNRSPAYDENNEASGQDSLSTSPEDDAAVVGLYAARRGTQRSRVALMLPSVGRGYDGLTGIAALVNWQDATRQFGSRPTVPYKMSSVIRPFSAMEGPNARSKKHMTIGRAMAASATFFYSPTPTKPHERVGLRARIGRQAVVFRRHSAMLRSRRLSALFCSVASLLLRVSRTAPPRPENCPLRTRRTCPRLPHSLARNPGSMV